MMKSHCRKPHKTSHIRPSHHKQYAVRVENISCFFTQQVRNNKQTNVDTSITNEIHNDNTLSTNDNSITNDTSITNVTSITNDNQDVLAQLPMKEGTSFFASNFSVLFKVFFAWLCTMAKFLLINLT